MEGLLTSEPPGPWEMETLSKEGAVRLKGHQGHHRKLSHQDQIRKEYLMTWGNTYNLILSGKIAYYVVSIM